MFSLFKILGIFLLIAFMKLSLVCTFLLTIAAAESAIGLSLVCIFFSFFISVFIFYEVAFCKSPVYVELFYWVNSDVLNLKWSFIFQNVFLDYNNLNSVLLYQVPKNFTGWFNGVCYKRGFPAFEKNPSKTNIKNTHIRLTKLEIEHLPRLKKDGSKIDSPYAYFTATKRNRPWDFYSYLELELTRKGANVEAVMTQIKQQNSDLYGPTFGIFSSWGKNYDFII